MNLLLLLSALLSALSGVGQAVRGVRAPAAVCASVASAPIATVRQRLVAERPLQPLPRATAAVVVVLVAIRITPAEAIFAGRRRE